MEEWVFTDPRILISVPTCYDPFHKTRERSAVRLDYGIASLHTLVVLLCFTEVLKVIQDACDGDKCMSEPVIRGTRATTSDLDFACNGKLLNDPKSALVGSLAKTIEGSGNRFQPSSIRKGGKNFDERAVDNVFEPLLIESSSPIMSFFTY